MPLAIVDGEGSLVNVHCERTAEALLGKSSTVFVHRIQSKYTCTRQTQEFDAASHLLRLAAKLAEIH